MTRVRQWTFFLAVALAFAGLGAWVAWQRIAPNDADDGAVAVLFAQTLNAPDGAPVDLARFRGQTVVLNFWATWCTPCVAEMPELQQLHDEFKARNATVLGIGIDTPSKITEFLANNRFSYPIVVGGIHGTELARQLGNPSGALPYTVVIDAKGRVIERKLGRIKLEHLRGRVRDALSASGT